MKTKPIVELGMLNRVGFSVLSRRKSEAGFVAKLGMAAGGVALAALAAFALVKTKAASMIIPGAPAQTAPAAGSSSAPAPEGGPAQVENAVPGAAAASRPASPAGSASLPGAASATAKVETPSGPRNAPAGMVFLTKRVTITKETGMLSFPKGTLVVVKSRAGGKVKASIRGEVIEVKESDTAAVFEE